MKGKEDAWPSSELGANELRNLRQRRALIVSPELKLGDLTDALDDVEVPWETVRLSPIFASQGTAIEVTLEEPPAVASWKDIAKNYRARLMAAYAQLAKAKSA